MTVRKTSSKTSALKRALHALETSKTRVTVEQLATLRPSGKIETWTDRECQLWRELLLLCAHALRMDLKRADWRVRYHERKLAAGILTTRAKTK
jgi:hypothetical protein